MLAAGSATLRGAPAGAIPLPQEQTKVSTAPAAEKTAGETYKNIKIFKDLPASQFIPAMQFMSASLGVFCDHCHVTSNEGDWPFEKDDKKEKKTAREMIKMMHAINDQNFEGRTEVTCATCHQGHVEPAPVPPIVALGARQNQEEDEAKPASGGLPPADQILDKYIQALGDAAALAKLQTRLIKGNIFSELGKSRSLEITQKAPGSYLEIMTGPKGAELHSFNGSVAWAKFGDRDVFVMNRWIEIAREAREAQFFIATDLKSRYPRRFVAGKEKIGDREAYVVRVGGSAGVSERLYFDVASGLLLRRIVLSRTPLGNLPEETEFEDYREVDGVKLPFTIRRMELNARWTEKFSEIKHNVPVDAAKFEPPAPPK
jgi:hypothetical protein